MSSEPDRPNRFADLWMLVHEGGLAIETCASPGAPVAVRTVLQLDGDRLTTVAMGAIAGLSPDDRLRLAARHLADVRARSVGLLSDGRSVVHWLRHLSLAGAGGVELFGVATHLSLFAGADWAGFLHDQIATVILLLCRLAAPVVLPRILRLVHGRTARALTETRHQETRRSLVSGRTT